MKKLFSMLITLFISAGASAQQVAQVKEIFLKSEYFDHERQILIYTPQMYDEYTATYYDVIYVFDAQNRSQFDLVHALRDYVCSSDPDESKSFIVVGICSPAYPEFNYYRNNDYLPMPLHGNKGLFAGNYHGGSPRLKKFIKNELMPYMAQHYRTSGHSVGIGHSLSASFVLDAMVTDQLFDDYIAISPNLEYDEYRLANDLRNYHFDTKKPHFIYLSMANEVQTWTWREEWGKAWRATEEYFNDKGNFPKNITISVKNFPNYEHTTSYLPSLTEALKEYLTYITSVPVNYTSEETYPVHIELSGCKASDTVYITGNQDALANWNPQSIKLKVVNDSTRTIDLDMYLPAYFKFTRGDWDSQAIIGNAEQGNLIISSPETSNRAYKLYGWADEL